MATGENRGEGILQLDDGFFEVSQGEEIELRFAGFAKGQPGHGETARSCAAADFSFDGQVGRGIDFEIDAAAANAMVIEKLRSTPNASKSWLAFICAVAYDTSWNGSSATSLTPLNDRLQRRGQNRPSRRRALLRLDSAFFLSGATARGPQRADQR